MPAIVPISGCGMKTPTGDRDVHKEGALERWHQHKVSSELPQMHKALLEHFINTIVFLLPGSASVMYTVRRLTEKLTKYEVEAMKKRQ